MAKLTMNTPGGQAPLKADFASPKRDAVPKWILATGGALFLTMFTGLVVTTTLLVSQSNRSDTAAIAIARGLEEPSLNDLDNIVTRQDVSLLLSDRTVATPGLAAPVQAVRQMVAPQVQKPQAVEVAAATQSSLGLGAQHRYQVPNCVDYLDTLVKITTVRFPLGSDQPSATDMIRARSIATAIATCDEVKVVVEGHSDRRGSEHVNMDLSWFRAQSVIDQLQREGFDISAMQPRGFGAKRPINLAGTVSGEAVNRRVQFTLAPRSTPSSLRVNGN